MTIVGHVDLARLELLPQDERQQQVERALERVEVELEVPDDHRARTPSGAGGRGPSGTAIAGLRGGWRRPPDLRRSPPARKNCHQTKNAVEPTKTTIARPRS